MNITVDWKFDKAWEAADEVRGWLTECEAAALWNAVQQTPQNGAVIEIGAYRGRSTTLLGESGRFVLAIDPLVPGKYGDMTITESDAEAFDAAIRAYPNIRWLRCSSRHSPLARSRQYNLLYIDGDHRWPSPLQDFERFNRWLEPRSIVAFHDYEDREGVTDSVRVLENKGAIRQLEVAGSMYIGEVL